jgi:hypothetical protein
MNNRSAAERLCSQKCEVNSLGNIFEERQAAAYHYRMNAELILIDQTKVT